MDVRKIDTALRIIEHFRTIYAEIPAQIMATLLVIAKNPGASVTDVADRTGQTLTSAARNVKILAEMKGWDADTNRPEPGLGLVEIEINPANQRQRLVRLTNKGQRFMRTLEELV